MQARPDIEGIKNRADEVPPDVHFKALSALGCERSSLPARAMCKHNCCGGENCITWLETQFRNLQTIAREATPALCAYAFELEKEIERLREAQRWTDTEYDTPDIGQAVLLYMPDKETDNIRAGEYMGEGDYRIGNKLYRGMEIDAWLPLPAPPERIGDADKTMEDT